MKRLLTRPACWPAFVLLLAAAAPSCAPAVSSAPARADAPADADAMVKKLADAANANEGFQAAMALETILRAGDKKAEETAATVLAAKEQFVQDKEVLALLSDGLAKKPVLAARLLVYIARAQKIVSQFKKGGVAVGQIVVEDGKTEPEEVMAQMPILPDGFFAGEVGDLQKPIAFRSHGYQNLDVPLDGKKGDLVYVGKAFLKPLKKDQEATLKGTVALDAAKTAESATLTLSMSVGPVNTPHNGYSPRQHWPKGFTVPVSKTGEFSISGLSPSNYSLSVTADDHVPYSSGLSFTPGEVHDAGKVRLFATDVGFYIGKPAPKLDKISWEKNYTAALERAKTEKKPLMVMMTATWCGWCKKLEADTLDDPWVRYTLSGYVVVQAFEDKEVEGKYGQEGYPTLVFTDSTGKMAHKLVGYRPVTSFLEECARADKKLGRPLSPELQTLVDKKIISVDGE